jgi:Na+/citrate or Na+/malate symporter
MRLRRAPKYIIGTLAIVIALVLAVFVSELVGIVVGAVAVLLLPWVPVPPYGGGTEEP